MNWRNILCDDLMENFIAKTYVRFTLTEYSANKEENLERRLETCTLSLSVKQEFAFIEPNITFILSKSELFCSFAMVRILLPVCNS